MAKRLDGSRCYLVRRQASAQVILRYMETKLPPNKKGAQQPPIFGPCLLWPNDWMHQDTTWYGGRSRPWRHCVRWGPSSPIKGAQPPLFDHVYCGQTAGWIKMPLGSEVDLGPFHIVLDGNPAPDFRPMSIVAKRSPISATAEHMFNIGV